jgi:hypothetical protein
VRQQSANSNLQNIYNNYSGSVKKINSSNGTHLFGLENEFYPRNNFNNTNNNFNFNQSQTLSPNQVQNSIQNQNQSNNHSQDNFFNNNLIQSIETQMTNVTLNKPKKKNYSTGNLNFKNKKQTKKSLFTVGKKREEEEQDLETFIENLDTPLDHYICSQKGSRYYFIIIIYLSIYFNLLLTSLFIELCKNSSTK